MEVDYNFFEYLVLQALMHFEKLIHVETHENIGYA